MATRNTDPYATPRDRDFDSTVNTRPATSDEVAYRNGYVRGKSVDQIERDRRLATDARIYEDNARRRTDNGISTGLVLGLVLASVAAVVGGLAYVYSTDTPDPAPAETTTPEATTPPPTNNETTIIERTIERTQEVIPAQPSPPVNVEVLPPPQPAPAPAPAPVNQSPNPVPNQAPAESVQPQTSPNQAPAPATAQ
jgi:outer membrane biosynthesis protein TonB